MFQRGKGRSKIHLLAISQNLPRIHPQAAGQNIHQGGLPRTVLSDQRVNFSLAQIEIHMI